MTVADFIDATLADSELDFRNSSYYKVYELYFTMYQEGLTQQQIQQRLLNSMDEEVSAVAKSILIEKYEITVKNYVQSMTAEATRLVMFVPKSLLVYQAKRVEMEVKDKMEEVQQTSDPERQMALLAEITALNKVRTAINNELGRV
jgi:CRISPR/Cas system CMR-associated protein Cmr3 (group 5 of RAMP superfamily)